MEVEAQAEIDSLKANLAAIQVLRQRLSSYCIPGQSLWHQQPLCALLDEAPCIHLGVYEALDGACLHNGMHACCRSAWPLSSCGRWWKAPPLLCTRPLH